MSFNVIRPIDSLDLIAEYYATIHKVIGGCTDDAQLWLIKQEGWITVVTYDGYFYEDEDEERFIQTLVAHGYSEFVATAWSKTGLTPSAYLIPATIDGIEEFRLNSYHWYVFFSGQPDWFMLLANTLDFILLAGPYDFVHQVLGCQPDAAFATIQGMSNSEYLDPILRKYYAHLLHQLQVVYPQVEPGTVIQLGLLE